MATYTVKSGDSLSKIGASLGINWRDLTGYKSGNPNLIYPGEVLTYGGNSPAPQASSAPAPAPAPQAPATPSYQSQADSTFNDLNTFDAGAKNPLDIYNAALEKLGITDARTRVTSLRQALINNQNLLDALPGNISARTQDSVVTENQRQRLLAMESEPIVGMGSKINDQFSAAKDEYGMILGEGKTQADLEVQGQSARRTALLDRLKILIERSNDEEKKRQWQAEYDRQVAKDKQDQANTDRAFAAAQASAAKSGGSGGGSSGGSKSKSSSSSSSSVNPMAEFQDYIAGQFKASGANPSRQTQDAWANSWFASKGISNQARQVYWDAFNSKYNRPANPYDDWLYKK